MNYTNILNIEDLLKNELSNSNEKFVERIKWSNSINRNKCMSMNKISFKGEIFPIKSDKNLNIKEYLNGDIYKGEIVNELRHGYGIMIFINGDKYNGEWKDDKMNGIGKYTWSSGSYYYGNWENNIRHGIGILNSIQDNSLKINKLAVAYNKNGPLDISLNNDIQESYKFGKQICPNVLKNHQASLNSFTWNPHEAYKSGYILFPKDTKKWSSIAVNGWVSPSLLGTSNTKILSYNNNNNDAIYNIKLFDFLLNDVKCIKYIGYWKHDKRNGNGAVYYKNKGMYTGNWINDIKDGLGVMKYENGIIYEGEWKNDNPIGKGKIIYPNTFNQNTYIGEHIGLLPHGNGEMYYTKDSLIGDNATDSLIGDNKKDLIKNIYYNYNGNWKDGMWHGHGILNYTDGKQYTGNFNNSKMKGKGKMIYNNIELEHGCFEYFYPIYIGEWDNNNRHGNGEMVYKNGDKYIGEWDNDNIHGNGEMIYKNGDKYIGKWDNGIKNGKMIYKNGDKYIGELNNNNRHGHGEMIYKNGDKHIGEWDNGIKNGVFEITNKNGSIHNTYFSNGLENIDKYKDAILIKKLAPDNCSICHSKINENITITNCNHKFHSNCLLKWCVSHNSCPNCRDKLYQ